MGSFEDHGSMMIVALPFVLGVKPPDCDDLKMTWIIWARVVDPGALRAGRCRG